MILEGRGSQAVIPERMILTVVEAAFKNRKIKIKKFFKTLAIHNAI
jgi:hypothetical protein